MSFISSTVVLGSRFLLCWQWRKDPRFLCPFSFAVFLFAVIPTLPPFLPDMLLMVWRQKNIADFALHGWLQCSALFFQPQCVPQCPTMCPTMCHNVSHIHMRWLPHTCAHIIEWRRLLFRLRTDKDKDVNKEKDKEKILRADIENLKREKLVWYKINWTYVMTLTKCIGPD